MGLLVTPPWISMILSGSSSSVLKALTQAASSVANSAFAKPEPMQLLGPCKNLSALVSLVALVELQQGRTHVIKAYALFAPPLPA